jgi:hypothetical protein
LKEFYMRWLRMPLLALALLTGMGQTGMGQTGPGQTGPGQTGPGQTGPGHMGPGGTGRADNPEIWFNPHVPLDMMNMWTDDAPWQHAAHKVQVLGLVHWWIGQATDAQILEIADFAKRHHMKIAFEAQAIELLPGQPCTTEGYSFPGELASEAGTLQRLGVQVDFITMDEPLQFGYYATVPGACQYSVADLAANVAANINTVLALYPNAQIYEVETVPGAAGVPGWRDVMSNFQNLFAQATGNPIRGVETDIGWDTPAWIPALQDLRNYLRERNMRLGIIEDGSDVARSNLEATAAVVQHFEYMEGTLGIIPDFAEFTTWLAYPQYNMPETDPSTQTWEIDRYFRQRTLLQAQFVGQGAQGKLTDDQGKPIAGATINGYVPGVDFSQPLPTTVIQEVVPANAVQAVMGIRLNAECLCAGVNDVLVGTLNYQETQGGTNSQSFLWTTSTGVYNGVIYTGESVGGTEVTRLITTAAQQFYPNSYYFPVTPGAQYSFTVPAATVGGDGWYGNVFLLWVDANGNGIVRVNVIPDPGKRLMSTATTAADGTFQLSNMPRVGPGSAPVTVEFAGDATHRSVAWTPLQ